MPRSPQHLVPCLIVAVALSFTACAESPDETDATTARGLTGVAAVDRVATLADRRLAGVQNALIPGSISNDRGIRFGSIGSDIFRDRGEPGNTFWMNTDRGPNGQPGGRRTFAVPEFAPMLAHVKVQGPSIEILDLLAIVGGDGV